MKNKVLIIAEAGVNHNGSMELAKKLIDTAVTAGADIVKFQTFKAQKLVSKAARQADYQKANLKNIDDSQYNMLKKLELDEKMHNEDIYDEVVRQWRQNHPHSFEKNKHLLLGYRDI
jgi:N,N'-diacetyllegionaminate synthase